MILGIHHVAISVPDLTTALEFYCGVLGFEELSGLENDGDDPASDQVIGLKHMGGSTGESPASEPAASPVSKNPRHD